MPKMHVKKSIFINNSPEKIYEVISDFSKWQPWSPWLIMEPGVKVNVRDDKKYYEWEGDITGSGNMTILSEKANKQIDYDLLFLKPWKSKAKVSFFLSQKDTGTEVTWTLNSSLPFFLFWMKKSMETFVGMDYDRGLNMLKDYVEDGKVHSKLEFVGNKKFEGGKYIGINTTCPMEKMGDHNKKDFEKLMPYVKDNLSSLVSDNHSPFTIYHNWDIKNGKVTYTAGILVEEFPSSLPDGFISGEYPKINAHSVQHIGPYRHLGNPWTAQMMRQRAKKFKVDKKASPLEIYHNNPGDTPELELKTEILMPIK